MRTFRSDLGNLITVQQVGDVETQADAWAFVLYPPTTLLAKVSEPRYGSEAEAVAALLAKTARWREQLVELV